MSTLKRALLSVGTVLLMFVPTDFFLAFKEMLKPEGFWQKFIFVIVGVYALGAMQIAFIVIGIVTLVYIWKEL